MQKLKYDVDDRIVYGPHRYVAVVTEVFSPNLDGDVFYGVDRLSPLSDERCQTGLVNHRDVFGLYDDEDALYDLIRAARARAVNLIGTNANYQPIATLLDATSDLAAGVRAHNREL